MISLPNAYRYHKSAKYNIVRCVSRTTAASEMEFFVIIVSSFKPLSVFAEKTVLDVLKALDPPLIRSDLLMTSNNLIFSRLLKYKITYLENGCKVETSRENFLFPRNTLP